MNVKLIIQMPSRNLRVKVFIRFVFILVYYQVQHKTMLMTN